jgi:hypothetical protein
MCGGVAAMAGAATMAGVAEVANSIHINSTVLFLFSFSCLHLFLVHPIIFQYFICHMSSVFSDLAIACPVVSRQQFDEMRNGQWWFRFLSSQWQQPHSGYFKVRLPWTHRANRL